MNFQWIGRVAVLGFAVMALSQGAFASHFQPELIEPGKTPQAALKDLLGKPRHVLRERGSREYYFYDAGEGSAIDATVAVRSGVVEYVSYLCGEKLQKVQERYKDQPSTIRSVESSASGFSGKASQLLYDSMGRGFVFDPRTKKVRACVAWMPGRKFDELGR